MRILNRAIVIILFSLITKTYFFAICLLRIDNIRVDGSDFDTVSLRGSLRAQNTGITITIVGIVLVTLLTLAQSLHE